MKEILLIISIAILLTSCGRLTLQEIKEGKKYCENAGLDFRLEEVPLLFGGDNYSCDEKVDEVFVCIKEYTNGLNEKYNNPDTVSNLREDNYSKVVETCKKNFGK